MSSSSERILTTHTGSLPRPSELTAMLKSREGGELKDPAAFEEEVREAVETIVRKQADAGIDIVNDGEQGRPGFATHTKYRLTGYGPKTTRFPGSYFADVEEFPEFAAQRGPDIERVQVPICTGPIAYQAEGVHVDVENLTRAARGEKVAGTFLTSVAPGELSVYFPNEFYTSQDQYLSVLADRMREEYEAIYKGGHIVQLDAPDLTLGFHIYFRGSTVEEFRRKIEQHVEVLNAATANIPPESMRLHVCYGPTASPHHRDVELGDVLDIILRARPAGLNFEGANCRHEHDWRLFKDRFRLPDGKYLILGVIDVTTNRIEHPELVAERIVRLAHAVGRENVVAGTDCGFGTAGRVVPSCVWAKLRSLAEGARIASEELW